MALNSRTSISRMTAPTKHLGARCETRTALGNIQNKITIPSRNVPNQKLPVVKSKVAVLSDYRKENQVFGKPVAVVHPVKEISEEEETHDLSRSVMEISISDSESEEGFSSSILPRGVSDIDSKDAGNQFLCCELVMDIYNYLRQLERQWKIHPNFLEKQREVTPRMRGILVDWLNQVHSRFGLLQETLYLTVATIDRFLQELQVSRKQLQLVGVTAMFIASKYEEMYAPAVDDFVYITDNAYSKRDIFKMECLMLKTLQFSLGRPLPLHFLRRNTKAGDCDAVVHTVAKYMLELSLQDYELAVVPPSLLAAAALRLSLKIMDDAVWTRDLEFYSGYTELQISSVMTLIAKLLIKSSTSKLQAVRNKFASSKFLKVSTLPQLSSKVVQNIAAG